MKRIYVVTCGTDNKTLVRATSQAQAIGHVVRSLYTAEVASQDDIVALLAAGKKVEEAGTGEA